MCTLAGCSAVVTGGLTGQELAIATELARRGASVAVGPFIGHGRAGDAAAYPEQDEARCVPESLTALGTAVYAGHLDVRDAGVRHLLPRRRLRSLWPS